MTWNTSCAVTYGLFMTRNTAGAVTSQQWIMNTAWVTLSRSITGVIVITKVRFRSGR
jgi:hypothetical protein